MFPFLGISIQRHFYRDGSKPLEIKGFSDFAEVQNPSRIAPGRALFSFYMILL